VNVEKTSGYYLAWLSIPAITLVMAIFSFYWASVGLTTPGAEDYGNRLFWIASIVLIMGIAYFSWIWLRGLNVENSAKEIFETCPFCGSPNTKLIISTGKETVECLNCGAKWTIDYSLFGKIESITLIAPDREGERKNVLGIKKPVEFWINLKNENLPTKSPVQKSTDVSDEDIEAKLRKLKKLYDDGLLTEEEYQMKKKELLKML